MQKSAVIRASLAFFGVLAQELIAKPAHDKNCLCVEGKIGASYFLCSEEKFPACKAGNCPLTSGKGFCTVKIDGMTCVGCAVAAQNAFLSVPGVVSAKVDWGKGIGVVGYDVKKVSPDSILRAKMPPSQLLKLTKENGPVKDE